MEIEDRVGLAPEVFAELARDVAAQRTLDEVVRWGLRDDPPRVVTNVVVQDEYTHDVVMPYRGPLFLVYDTT
jgi:hypothetical protein